MKSIVLFSILISFILTFSLLPRWIKKCNRVGLVWEDMNKFRRSKTIASSGGVVVVMAFILSVLSYIATRTFFLDSQNGTNVEIFASLTCILILSLIGLTDDLFGWRKGGLSRKFRFFLAIAASVPLIVINAGTPTLNIPLIGHVYIGLLYPLFFIPVGIVGATTTYNFLAGFNGLEAGQGILILSFLSFIAYITGSPWLTVVGLCMVASLLGFYIYNKYPAKVFPGDILTYSVGGLIAIMAILGNFEKIAFFIFAPYILETLLKIRGRLKKHSFGKSNKDGSLDMPYPKIYSLTHLCIFMLKKIKRKVYEKDVTYLIFILQISIMLFSLIVFRRSLF